MIYYVHKDIYSLGLLNTLAFALERVYKVPKNWPFFLFLSNTFKHLKYIYTMTNWPSWFAIFAVEVVVRCNKTC